MEYLTTCGDPFVVHGSPRIILEPMKLVAVRGLIRHSFLEPFVLRWIFWGGAEKNVILHGYFRIQNCKQSPFVNSVEAQH